jgi:cell wall-associated NlpC family hydrolase
VTEVIWTARYPDAAAARAALIAEALTWVGTPWAHAQDLKGSGVDCAMLMVRVHVDTGVIAPFDPRPYPSQWFLHHEAARFLDFMRRLGGRPVEAAAPGDVRMYSFGRHAAHAALVIDGETVVHASAPARQVLRDSINAMSAQFAGAWSLFP